MYEIFKSTYFEEHLQTTETIYVMEMHHWITIIVYVYGYVNVLFMFIYINIFIKANILETVVWLKPQPKLFLKN